MLYRLLFPVLALALPFLACADEIRIKARPVAMHEDDLGRERNGRLQYLGGVSLTSGDPRFGGFSGLALSADGSRLIAVSDRGDLLRATVVRNRRGGIRTLEDAQLSRLPGDDGKPLAQDRGRRDAEAVTIAGAEYCISFERRHRILCYPLNPTTAGGRPRRIVLPASLRKWPWNGGIEALEALGDGRLLALSEEYRSAAGNSIGWILDGTSAARLELKATGRLSPVDLARLPGGDLLLAERYFSYLGGLIFRLSRIDGRTVRPGAVLVGRELALVRPPWTVDNFEGLAIWSRPERAGKPALIVHLISDDNFSVLQRTLLMTFRLLE